MGARDIDEMFSTDSSFRVTHIYRCYTSAHYLHRFLNSDHHLFNLTWEHCQVFLQGWFSGLQLGMFSRGNCNICVIWQKFELKNRFAEMALLQIYWKVQQLPSDYFCGKVIDFCFSNKTGWLLSNFLRFFKHVR